MTTIDYGATFLSDGSIALRAVERSDLDLLYLWENDTSQWAEGSSVAPFSRKLLADYIAAYSADIFVDRQLRMMIDDCKSGATVGIVDLYDFDPMNRRAGVGILIDAAFRRRGYGRRALDLVWRYSCRHIGMHQLWAVAARDNEASIALFKSAGYATCGSMKSWLRRGERYADALLMQRF